MTKILLKNKQAQAIVMPLRGGLLTDLKLEDTRNEPVDILWKSADIHDDASGWPMGGIPFLFPFAGRVYNDEQPLSYKLGEQTYHMPLHGFAYGLPWSTQADGLDPTHGDPYRDPPQQVTLTLQDTPATLSLFPFKFNLTLTYILSPQKLTVRATAQMTQAMDPQAPLMPAAPGFHPFLKTPIRGVGRPSECFLETSAQSILRVTSQGLAGKSSPLGPGPHCITDVDLQSGILTGFQDPKTTLVDRDNRLAIELSWLEESGFNHMVLWTREGQGFYCVEPWTTLPDALAPGHGIQWLAPGQVLSLEFSLRLKDLRR